MDQDPYNGFHVEENDTFLEIGELRSNTIFIIVLVILDNGEIIIAEYGKRKDTVVVQMLSFELLYRKLLRDPAQPRRGFWARKDANQPDVAMDVARQWHKNMLAGRIQLVGNAEDLHRYHTIMVAIENKLRGEEKPGSARR